MRLVEWEQGMEDILLYIATHFDDRYMRHSYKDYDIKMAREYIAHAHDENMYTRAIEVDGKIVGNIYVEVSSRGEEAVIGYYIIDDYTHKGIGTKAVSIAIREAYDILGVNSIIAYVYEQHAVSIRVLESNGFHISKVMEYRSGNGAIDEVAILKREK